MSITGIILAAVIVGGTGLFIGIFLGLADKKFAVEIDEREEQILGVLPGEQVKEVAFVKCAGTCEVAKQTYEYEGLHDCIMINMMQTNGPKGCKYGCLGEGSCVQACQFDAIHVVDGVAVVDKDACKACGKCIDVCPRHLIELVPYEQKHLVHIDPEKCTGCGACAEKCPKKIIM